VSWLRSSAFIVALAVFGGAPPAQAGSAATGPSAAPPAVADFGAPALASAEGAGDGASLIDPESGLPVAPPRDGFLDEIERAWFAGGDTLGGRATLARLRALEVGSRNAGGAARALIAPAAQGGDLGAALLAVKLAPDLPLAHVELARRHWQVGERSAAVEDALAAVAAIPRNLEATLWLGSTALVAAVATLVGGGLFFIALMGFAALPRAAHDLGDLLGRRTPAFARAALLAALLLSPLLFGEGLFGIALALLAVALVYGGARERLALALAAALLLLGLFPVARLAGTALAGLSSDPVAGAALSVREGIATPADVDALERAGGEDALAALALAVQARRTGHLDEAYRRYQALLATQPRDPVVMTNLANLHFRRGAPDEAIALYERASAVLDSAVLWFDLSQAYARSFRMEEFENALRRAQALDAEVVGDLSQQNDPGLVSDLPIPLAAIRSRMLSAADGEAFAAWARTPLAPGRLGARLEAAGATLLAILLLAPLLAGRFERAGTCSRCGVRTCARCDGMVWNSVTCENCHRIFNQPETTDATLRSARLARLRARESRVETLRTLSALLLPGFGGVAARRPDLAFTAILCLGWALAATVWRAGVTPDPLALGAAGPALLSATAVAAACAYVGVVLTSFAIRRNL